MTGRIIYCNRPVKIDCFNAVLVLHLLVLKLYNNVCFNYARRRTTEILKARHSSGRTERIEDGGRLNTSAKRKQTKRA